MKDATRLEQSLFCDAALSIPGAFLTTTPMSGDASGRPLPGGRGATDQVSRSVNWAKNAKMENGLSRPSDVT
eukprot:s2846_g4.t1